MARLIREIMGDDFVGALDDAMLGDMGGMDGREDLISRLGACAEEMECCDDEGRAGELQGEMEEIVAGLAEWGASVLGADGCDRGMMVIKIITQ